VLPTDLLIQRYQGEEVIPKRLPCSADNLAIALNSLPCSGLPQAGHGLTCRRSSRSWRRGDRLPHETRPAHLLESAFSTFEMRSLIDPVMLRQRVLPCQPSLCLAHRASATTVAAVAETLSAS